MRTTIWKHATGAALSSILALRAAAGFGHIHAEMDTANQVTQFCVPGHDDDVDAHRFYCVKHDDGSGRIGASAFT
jgi:hypothetical protein